MSFFASFERAAVEHFKSHFEKTVSFYIFPLVCGMKFFSKPFKKSYVSIYILSSLISFT